MFRRLNDTILKIKAAIYRYTGIYFAHKEEIEYLTSKKFWNRYSKLAKSNKDLNSQTVQGILIGMWQVKHGFYRPYSKLNFSKKFHIRIASYLHESYKAIKFDLLEIKKDKVKNNKKL
jgi:hypothetical protein